MRRVVFNCLSSASANVLLTAVVRDLHHSYPDRFQIDVRTRFPELWVNNPHLTRLHDNEDVQVIECDNFFVQNGHRSPFQFPHGLFLHLGAALGVDFTPSIFRGDIRLSPREKSWMSQVQEITGTEIPFWIICAGGSAEKTVQSWTYERFQSVVDEFRNRIFFVQVAAARDSHRPLSGALDLRGQTDLRQLIRLIYHAQGVLCPAHLVMHLSAAIDTRDGTPNLACVAVGGGWEFTSWQRYPNHQFLHTIGALPCCVSTGCGRQRTSARGDHSSSDRPENLCLDVADNLPRCMDLIRASEVIRAICRYFEGGLLSYLSESQIEIVERVVADHQNALAVHG